MSNYYLGRPLDVPVFNADFLSPYHQEKIVSQAHACAEVLTLDTSVWFSRSSVFVTEEAQRGNIVYNFATSLR